MVKVIKYITEIKDALEQNKIEEQPSKSSYDDSSEQKQGIWRRFFKK